MQLTAVFPARTERRWPRSCRRRYVSDKKRSGAWIRDAVREKMEREKELSKKKSGAKPRRS